MALTGFWIAYALSDGSRDTSTERLLTPGPTRVDYPEEPLGSAKPIPNGSVVLQAPLRDPRIRRWLWEGYPEWFVPYRALWALLEPLRSRYRYQTGNSPYVWLRDTESGGLRTVAASGATVTSSNDWFRVRVVEVSRRQGSSTKSLTTFETTILGFVIDDTTYNDWG